jgi:hypothetical protein
MISYAIDGERLYAVHMTQSSMGRGEYAVRRRDEACGIKHRYQPACRGNLPRGDCCFSQPSYGITLWMISSKRLNP